MKDFSILNFISDWSWLKSIGHWAVAISDLEKAGNFLETFVLLVRNNKIVKHVRSVGASSASTETLPTSIKRTTAASSPVPVLAEFV